MKEINIIELMKEMESATEINIEHVVGHYYMREYKSACVLLRKIERDGEIKYSTVGYFSTKEDLIKSV
ncbi:MAG: hypothetical protein GX963_08755, partial [Bacteroidales bacterium]|nr:hypothetical protein [Bacteroidales bacterium]